MHMRKVCAAAAALLIGAMAFQAQAGPRDRDYRKALKLYQNGMYTHARDLFETVGRDGDYRGEW